MDSVLAFQESVGILSALNLHRNAFYSSLIALLKVAYRHLVTVSLSPPHIHAHEHLSPVLALRSAGAAVYLEHAVHRIFLLPQHVHQLQLLYSLYCLAVIIVNFLLRKHVVLVEVERKLQLVGAHAHLLIAVDPLLESLNLLHLFLCPLRIIPKVGCLRAQLLLFKLYFLCVDIEIVMQCVGTFHHVFQLI